MSTNLSTSGLPAQAANNNSPGSRAVPAAILIGLTDLLAEVCIARLAAANKNTPPSSFKDLSE